MHKKASILGCAMETIVDALFAAAEDGAGLEITEILEKFRITTTHDEIEEGSLRSAVKMSVSIIGDELHVYGCRKEFHRMHK